MKLKLKVRSRLPAALLDGPGIGIVKSGLTYTVGLDYSLLAALTSFDSSTKYVAVFDPSTEEWNIVSLASVINAAQTQQIKTSAGDVNVAATDGLIIINKTVGQATGVNLPASATKIGPVKVVDWKGDAGTNAITNNNYGSEKFNGNNATWVIGSDNASAVFSPISTGIGYGV